MCDSLMADDRRMIPRTIAFSVWVALNGTTAETNQIGYLASWHHPVHWHHHDIIMSCLRSLMWLIHMERPWSSWNQWDSQNEIFRQTFSGKLWNPIVLIKLKDVQCSRKLFLYVSFLMHSEHHVHPAQVKFHCNAQMPRPYLNFLCTLLTARAHGLCGITHVHMVSESSWDKKALEIWQLPFWYLMISKLLSGLSLCAKLMRLNDIKGVDVYIYGV